MAVKYQRVERVPAKPFAEWLTQMVERRTREGAVAPVEAVATDLSMGMAMLYRRRHMLTGDGRPTESYVRWRVEETLGRAGLFIWDLYPEIGE